MNRSDHTHEMKEILNDRTKLTKVGTVDVYKINI